MTGCRPNELPLPYRNSGTKPKAPRLPRPAPANTCRQRPYQAHQRAGVDTTLTGNRAPARTRIGCQVGMARQGRTKAADTEQVAPWLLKLAPYDDHDDILDAWPSCLARSRLS